MTEKLDKEVEQTLRRTLCLDMALMESVKEATDGIEPTDFMLSFPAIYNVWALYQEIQGLKEELGLS